jgi:hypothetical protein
MTHDGAQSAGAAGPGANLSFRERSEFVPAVRMSSMTGARSAPRDFAKTRLPEVQRKVLWMMFEHVSAGLKSQNVITHAQMFSVVATAIGKSKNRPFNFAVVDEAQDLTIPQLRFLAALGADRPNTLFFAGDLGQRIFQRPFSWKSLGIDVRGRSRTLRVNYRTTHQIRTQADRYSARR